MLTFFAKYFSQRPYREALLCLGSCSYVLGFPGHRTTIIVLGSYPNCNAITCLEQSYVELFKSAIVRWTIDLKSKRKEPWQTWLGRRERPLSRGPLFSISVTLPPKYNSNNFLDYVSQISVSPPWKGARERIE